MKAEDSTNERGSSDRSKALDTLVIHSDRRLNDASSISPPIYQTSTFRAESSGEFAKMATEPRPDRFYTRYGNPTHKQAEAVVTALERTEAAMVTASGMAAISTTVLTFVQQGDHVIAQQHHYGGTKSLLRDFLPQFGVETTFVDQTDASEFEKAIKRRTKLILVETPSNPLMKITDLRSVARIARECGVLTLADNTFATPMNQHPIELGVDLVVHSGTKYMGGHSDLSAGVIAGPELLVNKIWKTALKLGSVLSPFDSWLLLRGLRTLSVRVERHNRTALAVARFLGSHPKVSRVYYPGLESHPQHDLARSQMSGFTGILSFELKNKNDAAKSFLAALHLASCAASVGGVETSIVQPTALLAQQVTEEQFREVGVQPDLLRLSVGLEDERDLIADLGQALAAT
jgi:methionine-gamma-lyase